MYKYQKGFAPIIIALVVLILAGIGVTGYYLINKNSQKEANQNQQNIQTNNINTNDWKTYTDNYVGFEIKYPSNWESPFKEWSGGVFSTGISIDNDNYCVVDVTGWSGSNDAEIADLIGKGYIKTSIKIDGVDGIRLTRNPSGAGLTEAVYFEANGKNFRIGRNRGFGDKIEQDCIKNFNQILTTFKLINTESTSTNLLYKNDFDGSSLYGSLYKSEDNGKTWKEILKQYKGEIVYVVDPRNPKIIYAGDKRGNTMADDMDIDLLKSTDAGDNWINILDSLTNYQLGILYGVDSLSIDVDKKSINVTVETDRGNIGFKAKSEGDFPIWSNSKTNIDSIDKWIAYKNEKYEYEIKHPDIYALFQGLESKKEKTIPADLNSQKIYITNNPFMFFCCDPTYLTIEILDTYSENLEKLANENYIQLEDLKSKKYIEFNGEQAYQVDDGCGLNSGGNFILINHNSKTYYIKHDCMNLSKEIISTFKFK